jgi:16S rRNA (cytidine1402-2'-O)-methyltransferase
VTTTAGCIVICPTPIGNLGDVSERVLGELRTSDVIACEDTRRTRVLLDRHGIDRPTVSLHEHNELARTAELVRRALAGDRVAVVSDAGMPGVSDPGARLISEALRAGVEVQVLPGPSAVTTALVASGLAAGGFTFCGFLPRGATRLRAEVERLDGAGLPLIAFESPKRLPTTLRTLAAAWPDRRAAVCRELTKLHQEVARGTLGELAERFAEPPRGEVTLVLAARQARPAGVDQAALDELAETLGTRQAADLAARLTGAPRNALYEAITGRKTRGRSDPPGSRGRPCGP